MGFVARLMGNGRQPPGAEERGNTADGALDTLGSVLRTFGDPAFRIDDGLEAEAIRGLCESVACHAEIAPGDSTVSVVMRVDTALYEAKEARAKERRRPADKDMEHRRRPAGGRQHIRRNGGSGTWISRHSSD